jgi:hypothetical protein
MPCAWRRCGAGPGAADNPFPLQRLTILPRYRGVGKDTAAGTFRRPQGLW